MNKMDAAQYAIKGICPFCHNPEEEHDAVSCDYVASRIRKTIDVLLKKYEVTGKIDPIEYEKLAKLFESRPPTQ